MFNSQVMFPLSGITTVCGLCIEENTLLISTMACSITCHVRCCTAFLVFTYTMKLFAVSVNTDIIESEFIGNQGVARWTV